MLVSLPDEEFKKIKELEEYAKELVHTRWADKEALEKHLQEKFELSSTLDEIDESGCVNDYQFLMGIFDGFGYIDISYLKVPYGEDTIYISEVSIDDNE